MRWLIRLGNRCRGPRSKSKCNCPLPRRYWRVKCCACWKLGDLAEEPMRHPSPYGGSGRRLRSWPCPRNPLRIKRTSSKQHFRTASYGLQVTTMTASAIFPRRKSSTKAATKTSASPSGSGAKTSGETLASSHPPWSMPSLAPGCAWLVVRMEFSRSIVQQSLSL